MKIKKKKESFNRVRLPGWKHYIGSCYSTIDWCDYVK